MNSKRQLGFTLIEAGTTLTLIATLAAAALPNFDQFLQRRQIEGVATELASDLQFARTQAVARSRPVRMSFSSLPNGGSCYVLHTGSAAACHCEAEGRSVCEAGATAFKSVLVPAGRTSVQANVGSIVYDPSYGTSSPAATVRVVGANGQAIHQVVNLMGRVRSCSPGGGFSGYRAC